jgi:hypothetical protein
MPAIVRRIQMDLASQPKLAKMYMNPWADVVSANITKNSAVAIF